MKLGIAPEIEVDEFDGLFRKWKARLSRDPLIVKTHQKIAAIPAGTILPPLKTAADVIAEQRTCCLLFLLDRNVPAICYDQYEGKLLSVALSARAQAFEALIRARVIFWADHELRNGVAGSPVPKHTVDVDLIPEPVWMAFPTDIVQGPHSMVATGIVPTLNAATGRSNVWVWGFMSSLPPDVEPRAGEPNRLFVKLSGISLGREFPTDYSEPEAVSEYVAMFTFLRSQCEASTLERLKRGVAKRSQRATGLPSRAVEFVALRRVKGAAATSSDEHTKWRHRWLVGGHMRNQWYPSENVHRLIWISPYIKGPEDKPFRASPATIKVSKVVR